MQREILFRAWCQDSKQYLKGDFSIGIESGEFRSKYGEVYKNVIIEQFTGLTDKNGVKIFEGDYRIDENGNKEHVFYSKNQGAFVLDYSHLQDEDETYSELLSHDIDNFEVIGNIHD